MFSLSGDIFGFILKITPNSGLIPLYSLHIDKGHPNYSGGVTAYRNNTQVIPPCPAYYASARAVPS